MWCVLVKAFFARFYSRFILCVILGNESPLLFSYSIRRRDPRSLLRCPQLNRPAEHTNSSSSKNSSRAKSRVTFV